MESRLTGFAAATAQKAFGLGEVGVVKNSDGE